MSRSQTEGRYVGTWRGRHVRRRTLMPALVVGDVELFPASLPIVDSGVAWLTLRERGADTLPFTGRIRYQTKDMHAEVRIGVDDE